jgi:outer membrane receptor protein involved in Fe transport
MNDATPRKAVSGRKSSEASETTRGAKRIFSMTPLAAAVVAALSPTEPVIAQEDDDAIEVIIVTATKRELDLQDVGQSITAFSTADIEKMGIKSMEDYVKALPSVVLKSERPGRNDLVMRGVSEDANTWYVDSQVSLYLDEQPMTTSSQQVSVRAIDMERIEALPGPQGTLFGASSQTGTMRMITNKPNFAGFSGQVEASYGSTKDGEGSYDLNGFLNIPLIDDVLSMRVVAYTSHDGGYVDNVYGESYSGNYDNADIVEEDFNEYDVDGGRVAVLWNMGGEWSTLFSLIGENTELNGSWETDPALGEHKIVRFTDEYRTDDWWSAGITLSGDLGFAALSATATKFDRQIVYTWDNQSYSQWHDSYYGYGLYDTDYHRSHIFNDQPQERETVEIRLVSQGEGKLQWMAGVYWEDVWDYWYYGAVTDDLVSTDLWSYAQYWACYYNYYGYDNVACPLADTDVFYSDTLDRSVEQYAAFAELSYDLTDNLTVIAGARWAEFERDTFTRTAWPEGLPPWGGMANNGETQSKGKTDDILYKFSVNYAIDDDRMVYALFSQGMRLGGPNSARASNFSPSIPKNFESDYMDNYELGIKSTWLDQRLQVNAQLFLMKWSDYQVQIWPDDLPWWVGGTTNADTAESKGIELSVEWRATDNLQVNASAFFADAEFTADVLVGDDLYRDGMPLVNSPDTKAYLSLLYDIPDVLGGDMWLWYDISYTSETWGRAWYIIDQNRKGLAPSRNSSNFQMGLDLPNELSLTLQVDNVWDQKGYGFVDASGSYEPQWFGVDREQNLRSLERPRTAWISVRKDFGGR